MNQIKKAQIWNSYEKETKETLKAILKRYKQRRFNIRQSTKEELKVCQNEQKVPTRTIKLFPNY